MARNYAAVPYEYLEEMEDLNDEEFGRLMRALLQYSMTGEPMRLAGNERFFSKRVMAQEDRFRDSYDEISSARSEAGKAGAASRWANKVDGKNGKRIFANGKNSKAIVANGKNGNTETYTDTDNYSLPSIDGKESNARKRFTPPTLEDVVEYAKERGSNVDAKQFFEYYDAGGWKDAKGNPVRNWKQKFLTWEKHESPREAPARPKSNPAIGTPGDYEREAIARLMSRREDE